MPPKRKAPAVSSTSARPVRARTSRSAEPAASPEPAGRGNSTSRRRAAGQAGEADDLTAEVLALVAQRVPGGVPLLRLSNARAGERGFLPFYVDAARREGGESEGAVVLEAVEIKSEDLHRKDSKVFLDCLKWRRRLSLAMGGTGWYSPETFTLDWGEHRRKLIPATSAWLKSKLPCPFCDGTKEVEAGSEKVAERWPRMDGYGGEPRERISCPGCSYDYGYGRADADDGAALEEYMNEYGEEVGCGEYD